MANINWNAKSGSNDLIDSNYLTPDTHPTNFAIDLQIEVYQIAYGWGNWNSGQTLISPIYRGTLDGQFTDANFTIDSTSDMRTSGSFSIILDYNSKFIVHANDFNFWSHVWLKVTKKYYYPNDIDRYPMFDYGDHIGLWNNNGLFRSDPSQSIIGWFVPNSGSYSYNAESRELSLSCTDIMSYLTDTQGGHLSEWWESFAGVTYKLFPNNWKQETVVNEDGTETTKPVEVFDSEFDDDKFWVSLYSSGFIIEGEKDLSVQDKQYPNYLVQLQQQIKNDTSNNIATEQSGGTVPSIEPLEKISPVWRQQAETYNNNHDAELIDYMYVFDNSNPTDLNSIYKILMEIIGDYTSLIPVEEIFIRLQNDHQRLPYDMDFSGDSTLYDVIKKVIDLYPRQTVFFDANRRLNLVQYAQAWNEMIWDSVDFRGREFYNCVIDEHWNINTDNIKNYTVVWGRDESCIGYYYITSYRAICPECGKLFEYGGMPTTRYCLECNSKGLGEIPLQRLHVSNDSFCVQVYGTRKQVIYNDTYVTDEECFNAAKATTLENCRAAKTLSVTLTDNYFSMYQWADKAVGRRIEYKSILTGETDVYTLLRWSNNFNSGTVTFELEPYYTCADEHIVTTDFDVVNKVNQSYKILPTPEWTYSVDENGLLTVVIHNKWATPRSLFKVYISETTVHVPNTDFWNWTSTVDFAGETCEVLSDETEDEYQKKVFRYQFTKNGRYQLTCQAWNPNIHPSGCPNFDVISVTCFKDALLFHDDTEVLLEDGENLYYS